MSTLAYGPKFSLKTWDDYDNFSALHLKIDKACGCTQDIVIPIEIWETIRQISAINLDLIDLSDDDLKDMVTKQYNTAIQVYQKSPKTGKRRASWAHLAFWCELGPEGNFPESNTGKPSPDSSADIVIESALVNYRLLRDQQRNVFKKIKEIQAIVWRQDKETTEWP